MRSGVDRPYVPEISRETIIDLVADMNRVGFGVLSGYLEPADLQDLRQFVETAVAAAGGEYVVFTGEEEVAGTLLEKLSASPAFVNLLRQVYEQGSGRAAPNQSLYQVLRCLKGQNRPETRTLFSLRLLCRDGASAGDHSITGERWPPRHSTEPAAGQIVVSLQSPRQDLSG
jgi:hypothetical protein